MKWNKAAMPAAIAALTGMMVFSAYMLMHASEKSAKKYVSVIVSDSGDNRWKAFTQGLNQAAQDNDVVLNIVSTGSFSSNMDEVSVISRELEYGANGLIVQPCEDDESGVLSGALSSTQSVLVCSDVNGEAMMDTVSTDGYLTGEMIAQQINEMEKLGENGGEASDGQQGESAVEKQGDRTAEQQGDRAAKQSGGTLRVGILSGNQELPAAESKLKGLLDTLEVEDDEIAWTLKEKGISASENLLSVSMEAKPVDILIALDNKAMESAIDYMIENPDKECRLYGEGRSEKCVYYLDTGLVSALAVPDEYTMGYKSLERLCRKMTYYVSEPKTEDIRTVMVTRENLHAQEMAWIVFPAVY